MEEKIKDLKYGLRRIDDVSITLTYAGYSLPTTPETANLWIIKKILKTDNVTTIQYSQGQWSNRASLIYL